MLKLSVASNITDNTLTYHQLLGLGTWVDFTFIPISVCCLLELRDVSV